MIDNEIIRAYRKNPHGLTDSEGARLWQTLQEIARLVIGRHFWYLTTDQKEDGLSEAICGTLEGLKQPWVDLDKNSPVNYVFTRMRNCLTNYYRSQLRLDTVDIPGDLFDFCEDRMSVVEDDAAIRVSIKNEYLAIAQRLAFFSCICPEVDTFFEDGIPELGRSDVMSPSCAAFVLASHRSLLQTSYLPQESV